MSKNINKNPKFNFINVLAVLVVLYIVYLCARIGYAAVQTVDYPNEYREAANIAMTQSILNGNNPYSLSTLTNDVPAVCYLYGPLMSVIAALIALVFPGVSLAVIHYGISFAAILLSAFLVSLMVKRHTSRSLAPVVAFMLTVFCHWRYGYVYGAPDSLGLCLLILALFVMSKASDADGKGKALCRFIPELSALMAVLTFFTKQYFLMVAATGAVYFLFISKKYFLRYAIAGVLISAAVFVVISITCPLYWTYAIYFLKGPGAGAAMGKTGVSYNNMQISYLGGMLLMLFIAAAVAFIILLVGVIKHTRISFNIKKLDAPLIVIGVKNQAGNSSVADFQFYILFWLQLLLSGIVLRYIGNNAGAFLSYYLQLFAPALVVVSVCSVDNFDYESLIRKAFTGIKVDSLKRASVVLCAFCYIVFVGYTIYKVEPRLVINILSQEELANWQQAYELLDEYIDGDIYYLPPLNYHGYEHNKYIYNDGQPFVISEKFLKEYNSTPIYKKLFPHAGELMEQHLAYREGIVDKVRNGEYSVLISMEDMDTVFKDEDLSGVYHKERTIPLRTGNWAWDIDFWVK